MKISVIMPTYNSGKHIGITLDSLFRQTFKDMELIIVDSESSDDTLEIIELYKSSNMPIKLINTSYCSPAIARNIGMEAATSDYLSFCDSDDKMKPDMLESLYEAATNSKADITVCDFDMVYDDRRIERFANIVNNEFLPVGSDVIDYYYLYSAAPKPNNYVWSRLYRREFLKDIKAFFPDTRYSEDNIFNLSILLMKPKIMHIGRALYEYLQHENSAMRTHIKKSNHGVLFLDAFHKAFEVLKEEHESIREPILAIYAYTRVRSILFYSWQANQSDLETSLALDAFISDDLVKKHLYICIDKNYISRYCKMHNFSDEWERIICEMIYACLGIGVMPNMSEVFG